MSGTCCTSGKMPHLGQDSLGSGTRTGCYQQVCLGILIMVMLFQDDFSTSISVNVLSAKTSNVYATPEATFSKPVPTFRSGLSVK
jgi:hypothetical protein